MLDPGHDEERNDQTRYEKNRTRKGAEQSPD